MFGPLLTTESVTMIKRSVPISCGGGGLLPGRDAQTWPQDVPAKLAYPLKLATPGVTVPLMKLFFHHCEPQKLTVSPTACGSTSPMTNCATPTAGPWTTTVLEAELFPVFPPAVNET